MADKLHFNLVSPEREIARTQSVSKIMPRSPWLASAGCTNCAGQPVDESVAAIGSGGPFALAAATALLRNTNLGARKVAEEAMGIAGKICIYTNENVTYEELG